MEMNDRALEAAEDEALVGVTCNAALNRADDRAVLVRTDRREVRVARRSLERFGQVAAAIRQ